jgi:hypothetical protein
MASGMAYTTTIHAVVGKRTENDLSERFIFFSTRKADCMVVAKDCHEAEVKTVEFPRNRHDVMDWLNDNLMGGSVSPNFKWRKY